VHIDKVKPFLSEPPRSWLKDLDQSAVAEPDTLDAGQSNQEATGQSTDCEVDSLAESTTEMTPLDLPIASSVPVGCPTDGYAVDGSQPTNLQHFAVDEDRVPRPKRRAQLPARYRD